MQKGTPRLHPSWLLTLASATFVTGIVGSKLISVFEGGVYCLLAGLLCCFTAFLARHRTVAVIIVMAGGLLLGYARGAMYRQSVDPYKQLLGKQVVLSGRLQSDPERSRTGEVNLRLYHVEVEGWRLGGTVWSTVSHSGELKRSDVITISGRVSPGFGTVAAAVYRAQVVSVGRNTMDDPGLLVRDRFAASVRRTIKDPEAFLANGFLVGAQASLPEKMDTDLKLLGLSHIVVASGYNLTILVRFARRLFLRISRFTALVTAMLLVLMFTAIAGNSPSMMRAAIVVIMSLLAWFYGRKLHPIVLLSISAAVSTALKPEYAWGDIGWLLSFGSFVGVLILSPLIHSFFWAHQPAGFVRQLFIETLSAYAVTLPLVIFIFGRFSAVSILANMLVLPLIAPVMALTFLVGVVSVLIPPIAPIVGLPAQLLLQYITSIVGWLSGFSFASSEVSQGLANMALSYLALLGLVLFLWRRSGHDFRTFNVIE